MIIMVQSSTLIDAKLLIKLMAHMNSITEEKERRFLARPLKEKHNQQSNPDTNIFASYRSTEPLPTLGNRLRGRSYDFVGGHEFKEKYTEPEHVSKVEENQNEQNPNQQNNLTQSLMNSTINRKTIMSKLTHEQNNMITKEMRQMNRYRQYQQYWENKSHNLKKMTLREKGKTLLEDNVKDLYVHQNQDRMDVINNFVVNMWEMSLRNNNKILQRHIIGNKFKPVQLEEMLQTDRGIKTVERSIPVLPLEKLKSTKKRDLSLSGRNRALSVTNRTGGASTERISLNQTPNQEEVYKISYTGNVRWMSTEGL